MYEDCKKYGPYLNKKDNRYRIILKKGKELKTISYPKYLVENFLNRKLTIDETIHHRDKNPLNNDISNLEVIGRSIHAKRDVKRRKIQNVKCIWCGKCFEIKRSNYRNRGRAGPFCSRHCSGSYGQKLQKGEINKLSSFKDKKEYYYLSEPYGGNSISVSDQIQGSPERGNPEPSPFVKGKVQRLDGHYLSL